MRRRRHSDVAEEKRATCRFCGYLRVFFKAVDPTNALKFKWICRACWQEEAKA